MIKSSTITCINYLYNTIALKFVNIENHKYKDSHENSLIMKIFVFRMVTNLTAIILTVFVDQDIHKVKQLIYTLLVMKDVSDLGLRFIYPGVILFLKKRAYFFVVKRIQMDNYRQTKKEINRKKAEDEFRRKIQNEDEKLNINVYNIVEKKDKNKGVSVESFLDEISNKGAETLCRKDVDPLNTNQSNEFSLTKYCRKMKVINCSLTEEEHELNPDSIEINSFLNNKEDIVYYYADVIMI